MRAQIGRAVVGLCVVGMGTLVPVGTAHASDGLSAAPALLQSNWYWHKVASDAPAVVADPGEPSQVPDGDLPVASRDGHGTPSKIPVMAFDLPDTPLGTTVSTFTVTLTIDSKANNLKPDTPKLVACLALRNWVNGKGGEADTVNAPQVDATAAVPGVFAADGNSVTFSVPKIAQSWVDDVNYGLEILPAKDYTTPFQVSFLGGPKVAASMTYTPGVTQPTATPTTPPVTPTLPPAPSTGNSSGGFQGPPPLSGGFNGQPQVPTITTGPTPVAVAPTTSPQTTEVSAARDLPEVSGRPTAGLFWAGVALLGLLVVVSITLGGEPLAANAGRGSRLAAVLRARSTPAVVSTAPGRPSRSAHA